MVLGFRLHSRGLGLFRQLRRLYLFPAWLRQWLSPRSEPIPLPMLHSKE